MFTTAIERFSANLSDLNQIFLIHYEELSEHYLHNIELLPDWSKYLDLEINGKLLFIALRNRGKLVGYFTGIIDTNLHYKSCLSLALDLFYVLPDYRGNIDGQNGGIFLLNAVKREAIRRGVKAWTMGRKSFRGKHMEKLLLDAGFKPFEVHYIYWFE